MYNTQTEGGLSVLLLFLIAQLVNSDDQQARLYENCRYKMASHLSISAVNKLKYDEFAQTFGNVVEKTPFCAAGVFTERLFVSFDGLVVAMYRFIENLPKQGRIQILRNYPGLGDRLESLSPESLRTDKSWNHSTQR